MRAIRISLCFLGLALAGCATPYTERSAAGAAFFGGVSIEKVGSDLYRVFAQGNLYTSPLQVRTFVLRRAAKQAMESGFEGFRIIGGSDLTTTQFGSIGYASVQGGTAAAVSLPFANAYPAVEVLVKVTNDPTPPEGFIKASDWP